MFTAHYAPILMIFNFAMVLYWSKIVKCCYKLRNSCSLLNKNTKIFCQHILPCSQWNKNYNFLFVLTTTFINNNVHFQQLIYTCFTFITVNSPFSRNVTRKRRTTSTDTTRERYDTLAEAKLQLVHLQMEVVKEELLSKRETRARDMEYHQIKIKGLEIDLSIKEALLAKALE